MFHNSCTFVGRLTRDPEIRYTSSGIAVANFTLAVDRPYLNAKKERDTDFIRVTVWRKLAETCANNLSKGRLVLVEGRLQIGSYTDKEGIKRQTADIVANTVTFLDWGKDKKKTEDVPESPVPDVPESIPDAGIPEDIIPEIDWPEDPPF
jgi:single-strand DNA-binding protein